MSKKPLLEIELKSLLKQVLGWSNEFLNGKKDYSFDVDDEFFLLSEKYDLNFKKGNLFLVYSLADYYTDAIEHNFQEVYDDYYLDEAQNDIREILNTFQTEDDEIHLPNKLKKKLSVIFGK